MNQHYEWKPVTEKPTKEATYKWRVPSGGFGTGLLPRWQARDFYEDGSEMWILAEIPPIEWPGELDKRLEILTNYLAMEAFGELANGASKAESVVWLLKQDLKAIWLKQVTIK